MIGPPFNTIEYASVERCHTIRVLRTQNLAEHSFNMLLIADYVYVGHIPPGLVRAIMHHDLAEYHTGDAPAPAKWKNPALTTILKAVERKFNRDNDLFDYEHAEGVSMPVLETIDRIEFAYYCIVEMKMGNTMVKSSFIRSIVAAEISILTIESGLEFDTDMAATSLEIAIDMLKDEAVRLGIPKEGGYEK